MNVTFEIPHSELGSWNEQAKSFILSPGSRVQLAVGASSDDFRLRKDMKI